MSVEQMIKEKGLNAPRVTPDHISKVVVSEQFHVFEGTCFTTCLLTLKNGFNVIGESSCASPENFDIEIGKRIARDDAVSKVWLLEGYLLKQKLYEEPKDYIQRLVKEGEELADKLEKLAKFLVSPMFKDLPDIEQRALNKQSEHMTEYLQILTDRLVRI